VNWNILVTIKNKSIEVKVSSGEQKLKSIKLVKVFKVIEKITFN